jgi:hypothetical protein
VVPNASRFDRILVMPPSTPPHGGAPTAPAGQPAFQPPMPQAIDASELEEPGFQPPPTPQPMPPQRGPIFPTYPTGGLPPGAAGFGPGFPPQAAPNPQPQVVQPQVTVPTQTSPSQAPVPGAMPVGVATPGMVVQPPAQPGQQVQPDGGPER